MKYFSQKGLKIPYRRFISTDNNRSSNEFMETAKTLKQENNVSYI
jgi:hypothetical protein